MQRERSAVPLPHGRPVVPWNKGRFIGPKPPLKPKQAWAIRLHLQREEWLRDLAMFDLAIDSKLRGCDLVRLKIGEVVVNATARHRASIIQKKTQQPVQFELTEQTRDSLLAWLVHRGGSPDGYVFPSPGKDRQAPQHPPVCPPRRRLGRGGRARQVGLRHPQPAPDQGRAHLQANRQPEGRADPARPYQAGKHGAVPGR